MPFQSRSNDLYDVESIGYQRVTCEVLEKW
jgi:hypothetical protein